MTTEDPLTDFTPDTGRLQVFRPAEGFYCMHDYCMHDYCMHDYCMHDYCMHDYCMQAT